MNITSVYWVTNGKTIGEMKENLLTESKEDLVSLIINERYNGFTSSLADYEEDEEPQDPISSNGKDMEKRVPYIGWFWRSADFANKLISIGDCGEFIGIMENNKWDHPERLLTEEECDNVIAIIENAMREQEKGGDVSQMVKKTRLELEKLWPYLQTLSI